MAKTYFEYADRLPESQINWFQVGKDITDAIKKEDELRQKRKAETEAAFRKDINELANAPQGNSDLVNKWTTNYSSKATDYLLQINKLLKAGAIKPKDYTLINQNLRDGTAILFNLSKEYQAEYEEKMKRAQPDGEGSASEAQIMGMIEGFGNIKDTEAVINPLDGSISVGKLVTNKDGVKALAEGADNLMTVNQLRNRIKQKIDKYKVNEALKGEVDLLGDVVTEMVTKNNSTTETGFISKITDPTKRKGLSQEGQQAADAYLQTEKNIINSKLTNPYHTSSILFDWANNGVDPKTGKPYQVVFDDKIAATSSHYILYSMKEGMLQPDFDTTANGREQKKEAEKYLTNKFRSMLEQKTELRTTPQIQLQESRPKTPGEMARQDLEAEAENFGRNLALYLTGNASEKSQGAKYFLGKPGITGLDQTAGTGFNIYEGGKKIDYASKVGGKYANPEDIGRSMISVLNKKNANGETLPEDVIIRAMKKYIGGKGLTDLSLNKVAKATTDFASEVGQYARTNVANSVEPNDATETVKKFKEKFDSLGFKFIGGRRGWGDDYIAITAPNGITKEFAIDNTNNNTAIANFIRDNRSDDKAEESGLFGSKRGGTTQPQPASQQKPKVNYGQK